MGKGRDKRRDAKRKRDLAGKKAEQRREQARKLAGRIEEWLKQDILARIEQSGEQSS